MKRHGFGMLLLAAFAAALPLVSCSKATPEDKTETEESSEAPAKVIMPDLILSLSINRQADARIPRGWPVLVRAVLGSAEGSVELSNPKGPWQELLSLEIKDASGATQAWNFERAAKAGSGDDSLELDRDTAVSAVWALESSKNIKPGIYEVFVSAQTEEGKAVRGPHRVEILESVPPEWKPEEKFRTLLEAEYRAAKGDAESAVKALDDFLSKNEADLDALVLKSKILKDAGLAKETLEALNEALEAFPAGAEPPEELLLERNRLMIESLKARE